MKTCYDYYYLTDCDGDFGDFGDGRIVDYGCFDCGEEG